MSEETGLEQGIAGNITDAVMDLVETIQLSWKSTPKTMQEEFEKKLREAIRANVVLAVRAIAQKDFPALICDLDNVRIKKGKVAIGLLLPAMPGTDEVFSKLSAKAKTGGEVLVILADPKDYIDADGHSRAEEDQKELPFEDE